MSTKPCPACGKPADGKFCSHCGASLEAPVTCADCGNQLPAGGRYCNLCGAPTAATREALAAAGAPAAAKQPVVPWVVAGVAVTALVAALALRGGDDGATATPAAPFASAGAPAGADPGSVDLSSMTARQAADRLYERVMTASESGDSAQARQFLPMALQAYGMVPPQEIDADARYHLGVLMLLDGNAPAARAQADTILAASPTHLFGLFNAARAEQELGNAAAARELYESFLSSYDAEVAKPVPEYQAHAPALEAMRQDASRIVDSL